VQNYAQHEQGRPKQKAEPERSRQRRDQKRRPSAQAAAADHPIAIAHKKSPPSAKGMQTGGKIELSIENRGRRSSVPVWVILSFDKMVAFYQ
jgi:hypothetical protein